MWRTVAEGRRATAGQHEAKEINRPCCLPPHPTSHHLSAAVRLLGVGSAPLLTVEHGYLTQFADTPPQAH